MKKSKNFYKDIFVGFIFILAVLGFLSGEFVLSSSLLALSSILSNISFVEPLEC